MSEARGPWPRLSAALLPFASGLVFAASTPPLDFQPGILLGLVGFAAGVRGGQSGFAFGLGANLLALRFVPAVIARFTPLPLALGWLALVLLAAAQAAPWAIAGWVAARLREPGHWKGWQRRAAPPWLAFAIAIYVATFVPGIFPWTPAGGLARWPLLLQTAEVVGERGTSFAVAAGSALFAEAILRRAARAAALGAAVFAALLAYGAVRLRAVESLRAAAPHAKVALLEPDFDPVFSWEKRRAEDMLARLTDLTRAAERSGAELTVWPESAYPYTLPHGIRRSPAGARAFLQDEVHGPVLTGIYLSTEEKGVGTNSAVLVHPDGAIDPPADKRHLLWFGETVPLADVFPILRRVFARGTGLAAGTDTPRLETGPFALAVLNCYEDTLPVAGREAIAARPNLLVNVTNDAWFSGSAESELHLRLAVLRAIETRRDLVRAVNRGPTTWVGATGEILARAEAAPGAGPPPPLLTSPALLDGPPTLYARAGDLPLVLLLIAWFAAALRRTSGAGAVRKP